MHPRITLSLACLLAASALCGRTNAATIFVAPCGNNAWAGINPACAAPLGPKRTIQAAINAASGGDFVHVLPGTYAEKIDLNGKAITLLGTGGAAATIIDGGNSGTVVTLNSLEGPGTIIRGFTIRNGNAAQGGGMLIALANPTIEECIFRDNFASDEGGGVACIAASPTITDCHFIDNAADITDDGDGSGGGLSISGGAPSIVGGLFQNNHVALAGGGLMIRDGAAPVIEDCNFELNVEWSSCGAPSCDALGGAAVSSIESVPEFSGCTFDQNRPASRGAVAIHGGSASMTSCQFTMNDAVLPAHPGLHGGALYVRDDADVSLLGCSFTGNRSNQAGGAVLVEGSALSATLCGFSGNVAANGRGGAIDASDSQVAVSACTFTGNSATGGGGGISMLLGALDVSGSNFTGNDAVDPTVEHIASGGGILLEDADAEVTSSTFTGNTSQYKGGGISHNPEDYGSYTDKSIPDVVVTNCTFTGNISRFGGGLEIDAGVMHVAGCTLDSNQANEASLGGPDGTGGALTVSTGGFARVDSCEFLGNSAVHAGGAITVYGDLEAVGCTFTGNSADLSGGAVYAATVFSTADLYSCRFNANTAMEEGSVGYVSFSADLSFTNCIMYANPSSAGSAAVVAGDSAASLRVTNSTIHNNSGGGGVISNDAGVPVYISNSIVWGHSGPEIAIFQGGVEYSDVQGGYPGTGNINANPLWVGALGGNYHLTANSPCIDAGRTMALPQDAADLDTDTNILELLPLDFDGNPRVADSVAKADSGCSPGVVVDMGAFEIAGVVAPPIMPGDANADGAVTFADITFVLTNWGACVTSCCPGDVDGNGFVGFSDVTAVLENWG